MNQCLEQLYIQNCVLTNLVLPKQTLKSLSMEGNNTKDNICYVWTKMLSNIQQLDSSDDGQLIVYTQPNSTCEFKSNNEKTTFQYIRQWQPN